MEDLDGGGRDPGLDLLARQGMRNAVVVLGDLDMVVEPHPAALPLGVLVGLGWQGREGRAFDLLEELASRGPQPRSGRSLRSSRSVRMASLRAASEKKRRLRKRARIQRPTICTPTSTLALSRGL